MGMPYHLKMLLNGSAISGIITNHLTISIILKNHLTKSGNALAVGNKVFSFITIEVKRREVPASFFD